MARTVMPASSFCAPTLTTRLPTARPVTCTEASSIATTWTGLKTRPEPLASSTQTPADPLPFTSAVTGRTAVAGPAGRPDRFNCIGAAQRQGGDLRARFRRRGVAHAEGPALRAGQRRQFTQHQRQRRLRVVPGRGRGGERARPAHPFLRQVGDDLALAVAGQRQHGLAFGHHLAALEAQRGDHAGIGRHQRGVALAVARQLELATRLIQPGRGRVGARLLALVVGSCRPNRRPAGGASAPRRTRPAARPRTPPAPGRRRHSRPADSRPDPAAPAPGRPSRRRPLRPAARPPCRRCENPGPSRRGHGRRR